MEKLWRKKVRAVYRSFLKALPITNRPRILAILFIYILISHIFLPMAHRRAFLFFARWDMFSYRPYHFIYDITWDEGQSFLFRDHRKSAKYSGVQVWALFYRLYPYRYPNKMDIPKYLRKQIINFCKCESFNLILLKGSLSDHIIYNKQLKTVRKIHYE